MLEKIYNKMKTVLKWEIILLITITMAKLELPIIIKLIIYIVVIDAFLEIADIIGNKQ